MKKLALTAAGLMGLYLLNRFLLIPNTAGLLHWLLSGYLADALAGGMLVVILFAALELAGRSAPGVLTVAGMLLAAGLFWEYITPLYLSRSVSDPLDVLAVMLGGLCCLLFLQKTRR